LSRQALAIRWLLGALLCVVTIHGANAQKASFPGRRSEVTSLNGRYMIRNSDNLKENPAHTLTLVDAKGGPAIKIYQYARGADVLWSPASDAFIINDYEGSNSTRPVLYEVPWTGTKTDILVELTNFLRSRGGEKIVFGNDHLYFTARRWLNKREVLCRLDGYGTANPNGFSRDYVYEIGDGFRAYQRVAVP
jgi:hypothetical protein